MASEITIHPEMQRLIDIKETAKRELNASSQRQGWQGYGKAFKQPYPDDMQVDDRTFPFELDGESLSIPVRVYQPGKANFPSPLVLYFHGGGFVKGDLDSGDTIAWGIAEETGAVVISIDYRLAPDHPYPAALNDAYASLRYCVENAASLNIDAGQIAVWGDSAGGNIAAALCQLTRDTGGPKIVAQSLCYPILSDETTTNSYRDFADIIGLSARNMDYYLDQYLGNVRPTSDPLAAPIKAENLSNLPPAHIHIAEYDVLADEGRQYATLLIESGNHASLRVAPNMIHGFLRARFDGPDAAAEFSAGCAFL